MKLINKNFILITALFLLLLSSASNAQFFSNKTQELLPEDQAFQVTANIDLLAI